jgi:choice-of-anchor B domain-containing protein
MIKLAVSSLVVAGLLASTFQATLAQDRFGSAVGVTGTDIVVLKPMNLKGPATLYRFGLDGAGSWIETRRFYPQDAIRTGEGFSASLAVSRERVMVASGDPAATFAATVLEDGAAGWSPVARLALVDPDSIEPKELDLAGIMSILQPPPRLVAMDGDWAVVTRRGGRGSSVLVFNHGPEGWTRSGELVPEGDAPHRSFGSALAVAGDRILVGSPGEDRSGAVYLFERDDSAGWRQDARLVLETPVRGQNFGTAVAFDHEHVVVGARGARDVAGAVYSFAAQAQGQWLQAAVLEAPGSSAGDRFGMTLAVSDNEMWVGAPSHAEGAGRVYRFGRTGPDGPWMPQGILGEGADAGAGYGSALALAGGIGVVGSPGARGGHGSAAAYRRVENGWSAPDWLDDGLLLAIVTGAEAKCDDGRAAHFTCDNVDLLAYLPIEAFGGGSDEGVSDLWGWTDPETGKEYVLVGRTGGAAFVDVSDPVAPVYLGMVGANRSGARDLKVYRDHLFFTGDGAGDHGLLVFDLTRLRTVSNPPVDFEPDARYTGIASAHNLILDPEAGYAYPVGASGGGQTCGGGLHMVDIRDPAQPTFAGCYTDTEGLVYAGRTHDGQCVVYRGPDEDHQGRQICFASNETALRIVDVTDKENPVPLAAVSYPGRAYIHQGWLTDDQQYFYLNDELDELVGVTDRTRTMILDVADLDDPVVVGEYRGTTSASDHNLYIKGDRMYQANYRAGLQVIDISDRDHPVEIGRFDTSPYPDGDAPGFSGAWTAYPFFESGIVVVSSRAEGLFVVKPRQPALVP